MCPSKTTLPLWGVLPPPLGEEVITGVKIQNCDLDSSHFGGGSTGQDKQEMLKHLRSVFKKIPGMAKKLLQLNAHS